MTPTRIAVAGFGYWGPNLARNIAARADAELVAICDANPGRRAAAEAQDPATNIVDRFDALLDSGDPGAGTGIDAIVLATPAGTHHDLGMAALEAGKHLLVEKPLAMTVAPGAELVAAAETRGLVLMAGHTFLYEAAVRYLAGAVASGELGAVTYLYAQRLNLGRIRSDVNAMWNLAPHDVSIVMHVLDAPAVAVTARGIAALQPGVEDIVFIDIEFGSGTLAHVHVSWLDPQKVRKMVLLGTERMVIYDDVSSDETITVFDKGFDVAPADRSGFTIRDNGARVVPIERVEPLSLECGEFVDCVRTGREPLTGGRHALEVVRVLEGAQRSLERGGTRVALDEVGATS
jgi:predicted dehydrogenase